MIARTCAAMLLSLALVSCVPWTVRPIKEPKENVALTPAAYVDSIWTAKLVPAVMNGAVDARAPLTASAKYLLVKGSGVVLKVDTSSRVGLAQVDIAPFDGRADLAIQIGPVLRGSALRDASGIVQFSDFSNQIQFADVGQELNNRVLKLVLAPIADKAALKGRTVSFAGALEVESRELMPVKLDVEARP